MEGCDFLSLRGSARPSLTTEGGLFPWMHEGRRPECAMTEGL